MIQSLLSEVVGDPLALSYNRKMLIAIFFGGDRTRGTNLESGLLRDFETRFRHVGHKKGLVLLLLPGSDTVCFGAPDADSRRFANTKFLPLANL